MELSQRSSQPELMDTQTVSYEQFRHCLREMETINNWTLAYGPTLRWLKRISQSKPLSTIIDVGSGGGDMLRHIVRQSSECTSDTQFIGIDLNPWSKKAAEEWSCYMPIHFETGDVFDFEPTQHGDVIISSLFAHHLNDEQLVQFLQWMERHATRGWFINDLKRHPVAYYGFWTASRLLGRHRFVRNDGPVSITRAFVAEDWKQILAEAGATKARIEPWFPFRLCVSRVRP